jgi:REP element-mobilizing transposase RayT
MRDFKRHTSTRIAEEFEKDNERLLLYIFRKAAKKAKKGSRYKIWKDEFHPEAIYSEKWFYQKMRYIHNNPIRKGLVTQPEAWKYSSARNWILDDHSIISLDLDQLGY